MVAEPGVQLAVDSPVAGVKITVEITVGIGVFAQQRLILPAVINAQHPVAGAIEKTPGFAGNQLEVHAAVIAAALVAIKRGILPTLARQALTDSRKTPVLVIAVLKIAIGITDQSDHIKLLSGVPDTFYGKCRGLLAVVTRLIGERLAGVIQRKGIVTVVRIHVETGKVQL